MPQQVEPADVWTDALDGPIEGLSPVQLRDIALAALAARRALDRALPPELIPDPVIDILLTLYTLATPGAGMTDTVLGQATTVGRTVADRYIQALELYGFVQHDGATSQTRLTDRGTGRVETALRAIVRSQIEFSSSIADRPAGG